MLMMFSLPDYPAVNFNYVEKIYVYFAFISYDGNKERFWQALPLIRINFFMKRSCPMHDCREQNYEPLPDDITVDEAHR